MPGDPPAWPIIPDLHRFQEFFTLHQNAWDYPRNTLKKRSSEVLIFLGFLTDLKGIRSVNKDRFASLLYRCLCGDILTSVQFSLCDFNCFNYRDAYYRSPPISNAQGWYDYVPS